MDDLMTLVKTFRIMADNAAERVRLADAIFERIEPEIRRFVHSLLPGKDAAEDVAQQALRDIFLALPTFKQSSKGEFFSFCNLIARRRIYDYLRKKKKDPLVPLTEEELWERVESSGKAEPLSAADRIDLKEAIGMVIKTKPECYDLLWKHYVIEMAHGEIGEEIDADPDTVRMRIVRCRDMAQELVKRRNL